MRDHERKVLAETKLRQYVEREREKDLEGS